MVTRSKGMALNLKMKDIAFCHPRSKNRLAVSDAILSQMYNLPGRKKKKKNERNLFLLFCPNRNAQRGGDPTQGGGVLQIKCKVIK